MKKLELVDILGEIEDVFRTMPSRATIADDDPENFSWLGRAIAALGLWNSVRAILASGFVTELHSYDRHTSDRGYRKLMVLLNEARSELRMVTLGPVNAAVGRGLVFDYFDEIRKQIELAKKDILFIDPYLNADFVSQYLPHVSSGVVVRLLGREKPTALASAANLFAQQNKVSIEVRTAPNLHDRYMIVDGTSCYQSGASFKDGGRNAPTTITQITDAFPAVRQTYEDLWKNAKLAP